MKANKKIKEDDRITAGYILTIADYNNGCSLEKIRESLRRSEIDEQYELCQGVQRAITEIERIKNENK